MSWKGIEGIKYTAMDCTRKKSILSSYRRITVNQLGYLPLKLTVFKPRSHAIFCPNNSFTDLFCVCFSTQIQEERQQSVDLMNLYNSSCKPMPGIKQSRYKIATPFPSNDYFRKCVPCVSSINQLHLQ